MPKYKGSQPTGGTVLDLRYAGSDAKILTIVEGLLEIDHLTLADTQTSSNPFVKTVRTTLRMHDCSVFGNPSKSGATCDQDAIVLGTLSGTDTDTADGLFAGYGTVIERCLFDRIRIVWTLYRDTNACVFRDNTIYLACGGNYPILIDGTGSGVWGNLFSGNLYELTNYTYLASLTNALGNIWEGEGYWDPTNGSFTSLFLSNSGNGSTNMCVPSWDGSKTITSSPTTGSGNAVVYSLGKVFYTPREFAAGSNGLLVRPDAATGSETTRMFAIIRSSSESSDPGSDIMKVLQNGYLALPQTNSSIQVGGKATYDGSSVVQTSGDYNLYPGNDQTYRGIVVKRGVLRLSQYTTAGRPSASSAGAGACYYDTTVSKPVWSDGSVWKDAAGNAV